MNFDVGVFWVLMRVLACGGLGVLVWEVSTAQANKRGAIEVRFVGFYIGCFWGIHLLIIPSGLYWEPHRCCSSSSMGVYSLRYIGCRRRGIYMTFIMVVSFCNDIRWQSYSVRAFLHILDRVIFFSKLADKLGFILGIQYSSSTDAEGVGYCSSYRYFDSLRYSANSDQHLAVCTRVWRLASPCTVVRRP